MSITITPGSIGSKVSIDGQEIHNVAEVWCRAAVDEPSRVTLELVAQEVSIEGEVDDVEKIIKRTKHSNGERNGKDEDEGLSGG